MQEHPCLTGCSSSQDVILTYSGFSLQRQKKHHKSKPIFNSPFGKFCSENPPSAAVVLSFSNPEAAQ